MTKRKNEKYFGHNSEMTPWCKWPSGYPQIQYLQRDIIKRITETLRDRNLKVIATSC